MDDRTTALLHNLRMSLLLTHPALLGDIPDDGSREQVRAGLIQFLGAIEDTLGMPRTIPSRKTRHAERAEGLRG